MMRRIAAILIALLMLLCGCSETEEAPAESTTSTLENAAHSYQKAYDDLKAQKNISVTVQHNQKLTQSEQTYSQRIESEIICKNIGTEQMAAKVTQKHSFDSYEFTNELVLSEQTGYYNIADGKFKRKLTGTDFAKEYPYLLALSPALYANIHGTTDGTISTYTFEKAPDVEVWLQAENAAVESASGNVKVNADGKIISCDYTAKYKSDSRIIEDVVSVQFDYEEKDIVSPNAEDYIETAHPEALLLIESAVGHLRQADLVSSTTGETIACKAYNEYQDVRTQLTNLHLYNKDQFLSRLDISTRLSSRGGEPTEQTQQIHFIDGVYTTVTNSETPVVQKDITDAQMKAYCTEYLESTIMMSRHITDIRVTESDDAYMIEFSADSEMAENLRKNICYTLYANESVFESAAESYKVTDVGGSVTIDKQTMLPVSSGIYYYGTYHISGHSYELTFSTEQTYTIPSEQVYDTITENL